MRLLLLGFGLSGLTLVLAAGYWSSHSGAGQAEVTRSLEPVEGQALDAPVTRETTVAVADTAASDDIGDPLPDGGGNTAPDGSMITSGQAGGSLQHGRIDSIAGTVPEGVEWVDFPRLALPDYVGEPTFDDEPRPAAEDIFPPEILALDGKQVAIDGFMMPLDFKERQVTAFILSPYPPGCHFGGMPRLDEWVDSTVLDEEGVPWLAYRAIRVTGTLHVGEQIDEYGYVTSIYRLDAERVEKLW